MKKYWTVFVVMWSSVALLSACGADEPDDDKNGANSTIGGEQTAENDWKWDYYMGFPLIKVNDELWEINTANNFHSVIVSQGNYISESTYLRVGLFRYDSTSQVRSLSIALLNDKQAILPGTLVYGDVLDLTPNVYNDLMYAENLSNHSYLNNESGNITFCSYDEVKETVKIRFNNYRILNDMYSFVIDGECDVVYSIYVSQAKRKV